MAVGCKVLGLCLSDAWIIQVGSVFGIAFGLFSAFATNTLGLFLGKQKNKQTFVLIPKYILFVSNTGPSTLARSLRAL